MREGLTREQRQAVLEEYREPGESEEVAEERAWDARLNLPADATQDTPAQRLLCDIATGQIWQQRAQQPDEQRTPRMREQRRTDLVGGTGRNPARVMNGSRLALLRVPPTPRNTSTPARSRAASRSTWWARSPTDCSRWPRSRRGRGEVGGTRRGPSREVIPAGGCVSPSAMK